METHESGLDPDSKVLAGCRDRLVNSTFSAVNDHDLESVSSKQTVHDLVSQFWAIPVPIADYQDTHVHIVAARVSHAKPYVRSAIAASSSFVA
jgi:hypothetical protein